MNYLLTEKKEILSCVMCHDAPCSKAFKDFDIARIIRAIHFENYDTAADLLIDEYDKNGILEAEKVCPTHVNITKILDLLKAEKNKLEGTKGADKIDLSCDICGVKLENPFLLSSSVVASNYEMCERAFEMGWAGISFKTISMMDMHEASPRFSANKTYNGDWFGFKNIEQLSDHSVEENMEIFKKLKQKFPSKVIIASIMGRNKKEWEYLASKVEEAGSDIIECNFSCPNMEEGGTGSDIGQDPKACYEFVKATRNGTKLPILAKMTPNITDIRIPAEASIEGGADGISAINTLKSITGVNIDTLVALPSVHGHSMLGGYSGPAIKPIALRYIYELASDKKINNGHISAMGGITTWRDAIEYILLGASSLQITTAVMQYGYRIIDDLLAGLKNYMAQRNYTSINQFKALAVDSVVENDMLERDTVVFPVFNKETCIGCGRCYISCRDGGHQAIVFDSESRKPTLNGKRCVGCQLCSLVCPTNSITQSKRISKIK